MEKPYNVGTKKLIREKRVFCFLPMSPPTPPDLEAGDQPGSYS